MLRFTPTPHTLRRRFTPLNRRRSGFKFPQSQTKRALKYKIRANFFSDPFFLSGKLPDADELSKGQLPLPPG
jgi:hypothetical protein